MWLRACRVMQGCLTTVGPASLLPQPMSCGPWVACCCGHACRVAELQDSFASKVQNMRQANQEQLAAAAREAKEREAALQV